MSSARKPTMRSVPHAVRPAWIYSLPTRESRSIPRAGLVYLRNRYLNPTTGRFQTPDLLGFVGSGVTLYAYVGNSPTKVRSLLLDKLGITIYYRTYQN